MFVCRARAVSWRAPESSCHYNVQHVRDRELITRVKCNIQLDFVKAFFKRVFIGNGRLLRRINAHAFQSVQSQHACANQHRLDFLVLEYARE